jgi:hypothetical protein
MADIRPMQVRSGPWDLAGIEAFLDSSVIPIRLASQGAGFPLVQSLWFVREGPALWCATRVDSVLARRLERDGRCGYEVSADAPPYCGVRGTATALLEREAAADILPRLIERYAQAGTPLASWLLGRLADEVAIRLDGLTANSWDYSARMS